MLINEMQESVGCSKALSALTNLLFKMHINWLKGHTVTLVINGNVCRESSVLGGIIRTGASFSLYLISSLMI